jgi:hypothetical protein
MRFLATKLSCGTGIGCALAAAILAGHAMAAEQWRMQYFYDQDRSSLVINDLQFPSPTRGVAVGYLEEKNKSKPVSVITVDGGAHWAVSPIKDTPVSLSFLNDSLGWMVAPRGLWQTPDGGKTWRKLDKSPEGLITVFFLDPNHGFAVGTRKSAYETKDGAKTWQPIAAAAEPHTNPEYTAYNCIAFATPKVGLISGYSQPPRADQERPDWLDPQQATRRREWPHMSIMLDTKDGGATWKPSTTSMFGRISRVSFLPDGRGLGLLEFTENFEWPSEVLRLDGSTGKSASVYKAKDVTVTDLLLLPSGTAYLAGVEVVGKLQHSPIPSKLKILKSDDLVNWQPMDVDYRAVAVRAMLRAAGDGTLWVATDTGMILKLTR